MNIFESSGYINEPKIMALDYPFIFQIGGRGTGKTYGILKELISSGTRFLYLRRTGSEIDFACSAYGNALKSIPGTDGIYTKAESGIYIFFRETENETGEKATDVVGYGAALSTFSNLRGVDLSDVETIFYDEFIPEKIKRKIRDEYNTLLNLYETVNRNREFQGKSPVKLLAAANANDITNPVFVGLGIVDRIFSMMKKGQTELYDKERGLAVFVITKSPISDLKSKTALYKLAGKKSEFSEMSLENVFALDDSGIKSKSLRGYACMVSVGELVIYKGAAKSIYVRSGKPSGNAEEFSTTDADIMRFKKKYNWLIMSYLYDLVCFESLGAKVLFMKYFGV